MIPQLRRYLQKLMRNQNFDSTIVLCFMSSRKFCWERHRDKHRSLITDLSLCTTFTVLDRTVCRKMARVSAIQSHYEVIRTRIMSVYLECGESGDKGRVWVARSFRREIHTWKSERKFNRAILLSREIARSAIVQGFSPYYLSRAAHIG